MATTTTPVPTTKLWDLVNDFDDTALQDLIHSNSDINSSKSGLRTDILIAIAVSVGVVLIVAIVVAVVLWSKWNKRRRDRRNNHQRSRLPSHIGSMGRTSGPGNAYVKNTVFNGTSTNHHSSHKMPDSHRKVVPHKPSGWRSLPVFPVDSAVSPIRACSDMGLDVKATHLIEKPMDHISISSKYGSVSSGPYETIPEDLQTNKKVKDVPVYNTLGPLANETRLESHIITISGRDIPDSGYLVPVSGYEMLVSESSYPITGSCDPMYQFLDSFREQESYNRRSTGSLWDRTYVSIGAPDKHISLTQLGSLLVDPRRLSFESNLIISRPLSETRDDSVKYMEPKIDSTYLSLTELMGVNNTQSNPSSSSADNKIV